MITEYGVGWNSNGNKVCSGVSELVFEDELFGFELPEQLLSSSSSGGADEDFDFFEDFIIVAKSKASVELQLS